MPEFQPFVMERMMSMFEQDVEYNLSESGVHPLTLGELLAHEPAYKKTLFSLELNYPHVNGIPELRDNIARQYSGASIKNILVTVGAIEANYITMRTLLNPADEIVVMLPNYMQVWGIAKNHDIQLKTFHLKEENGWAPDLDELSSQVTDRTKLIAVCNPNNPTGYILTENEMSAIIRIAEKVGAWILADEVYRGAERISEEQSPSFFGRYEKSVATGSMSKAFGLPGLRIGWVAAPEDIVDDIWARHEYTTISATALSNKLAALALSEKVCPRIIQRTRNYIRKGYPVLQQWLDSQPETFSLKPPKAAAIAFIRYHLAINSTEFAERLRKNKSVLIVPGDHFGMDHFVRVSFGLPHDYLIAGLNRIKELISQIKSE